MNKNIEKKSTETRETFGSEEIIVFLLLGL